MKLNFKKNKKINKVLESLIPSKFNLIKKNKNNNKDCIEIFKNLTTGKTVFIPKKDRYYHNLILGPTGSGKKYKNLILPLIYKEK